MTRTSDYWLPPATEAYLDTVVEGIVAKPGPFVDAGELREAEGTVNLRQVMSTLPEGLTESDVVDILRLSLLTECATESYAAVFEASAKRFGASWLGRFNEAVWVPDEMTHHMPFELLLLQLGYSQEQINREVKETQEKHYVHLCGITPIELSTFGMIQEYLTDNWHGLVAKMLAPSSPAAARVVNQVKKRETLHTVWYRDMTAIQIEGNPQLLPLVAESIVQFQLPSNILTPELQDKTRGWMPYMHADQDRMLIDLIRLMHQTSGSTPRMGRLLVDVAAASKHMGGPVPVKALKRGMDRLGGVGYGLVGEAILQHVGLESLFEKGRKRRVPIYDTVYSRVRGVMRSWLANLIHIRLDVAQA